MDVDYLSVARERRLVALETLERRQPALPGLGIPKLAPHPDDAKPKLSRERNVHYLDQS